MKNDLGKQMIQHPFIDNQVWLELKNQLVSLAKQEVLSRFNQVDYESKQDGSLITEADLNMQQQTIAWLQKTWPEFAIVGEELTPEEQNAALQHPAGCWILDPVDGTTNFANGVPFFSVSLSLVIAGKPVLGMVYDPSRDELFAARLGQGAELNHQPLAKPTKNTQELKQAVGIIDFKRLEPDLATALATKPPFASQRSYGSVALDWCWIAAGRGQIYLHGNQSIWDYAAGWLILNEVDGASSDLNGKSVFKLEIAKQSALAATTPELFAKWQEWINQHS